MERPLNRFRCALTRGFCVISKFRHEYFVNDDVNIMFVILFKSYSLSQFLFLSVYDDFLKTFIEQVVEHLVILALAPDDDRRGNRNLRERNILCKRFFLGSFIKVRPWGI